MKWKGWSLSPPGNPSTEVIHFFNALNWNRDEDILRSKRQWAKLWADDREIAHDRMGRQSRAIVSAGVHVPEIPKALLNRHPRFFNHRDHQRGPIIPPRRDRDRDYQPSVATPKRGRGDAPQDDEAMSSTGSKRLHAEKTSQRPSPSVQRQDAPMNLESDNEEFPKRHRVVVPCLLPPANASKSNLSVEGLPHPLHTPVAIEHCMHGWPSYEVLFGKQNDSKVVDHPAFQDLPYPDSDPKQIFTRNGRDPMSLALAAVNARVVPQEDFRMCNGSMGLETPLVGSDFEVWRIPKQTICTTRKHHWRVGIRVGDTPSGECTNWITKASQTPPGLRKINFREAMGILHVPNQIGLPGTQSTDAHLGFCFYTYQSASVALSSWEMRQEILMRAEGTVTRGGEGSGLQKAKVGFCPCCAEATHIAAPPTYMRGEYVDGKYQGMLLLQNFGPWAGRNLAARNYYDWFGRIQDGWDWAACAWDFKVPSPLLHDLRKKLHDDDRHKKRLEMFL